MASHHTTTPVSPSASAEEVEKKLDELYRQAAGPDAGPYSPAGHTAAREESAGQRGRVTALLDDVARRTDMLGRAREMLQAIAGSQARTEAAAPDATALLPETPQGYFDQAQLMSRLIARQKSLIGHSPARRSSRLLRSEASAGRQEASGADESGRRSTARAAVDPVVHSSVHWSVHASVHASVGQAAGAQRDIRAAKAAVQWKLAEARALLAQARALPADAATAPEGAGAGEPMVEPALPGGAARGEARKALAFARAQIGKPYVWGAAGPGSYDSSGLAQAAWKAAGVALPRTGRDQAEAGRRVPLSEALPGDLVLFHGEAGHVGVYAGDGTMIHAPRPGTHVREESVFYEGASAILGVVRPA
ncbi:C40 family peptidase [Streptomyces sp. NPDC006393]|uniref:C40 family peptidase n=1 Tax=Streptomyces sp. NPDC006393 TaxID=3156763 RepID=UPI0033EE27F1